MFQPDELKSDKSLVWSAGTGSEVWELFCACAAGDLQTVERLVDANSALVRSHFEYRTPLNIAVRENQMRVVIFLLERGADPFYNGNDLVEMAKIRGLIEMEALLQSKRPKDRPPSMPDIGIAVSMGNVERIREILDREPSLVNQPIDRRAGTPLVLAAGHGNLEVVRLLLERGADPNLPEDGNAPHGRALYSAVYGKHFDVAKLLLEHGANPNQEVESSADAPSIAIMNSDTKMIELLASYGGVWQIPVEVADS
jgi:ankyrin repeat protein